MQWDDVRIFLAVAQAGGLAAGARRLRLSQATVWRRLRALDEALGTGLFDRRSTGYVLTAQGTTFLRALEGVESTIAIARRRLTEGDVVEGEVRVTAGEFLAPTIAARAAGLAARYPRLQLEVVSASPIADFGLREADVAIRTERPHVGGYWISDPYPIRFALYATPRYIKRHGAPRSIEDLAGHRLIDFDHSIAHAAPEPWRRANLSDALVVLRGSSPHARHAAARTGLGLAMLPCCLAGSDRALREVLPSDEIGALDMLICVNTEIRGQARIAAALEFLHETLHAVK